jgi:hypothetical protein
MSLKVFDLQCDQGHLFEGWFSSHDDYDKQQARGLLTCPVCHSVHIQKMLSAPHLNLTHPMGSGRAHVAPDGPKHPTPLEAYSPNQSLDTSSSHVANQAAMTTAEMINIQAKMMMRMREMVQATENVGIRFAEEARAIHEGEAPERAIRGLTTPDERQALAEDGIMVVTLPDFLDTSKMQ